MADDNEGIDTGKSNVAYKVLWVYMNNLFTRAAIYLVFI